jgi:hypothetical protein
MASERDAASLLPTRKFAINMGLKITEGCHKKAAINT